MTMNTGAGVADFDVRPQRAELASGVRSRAAANHLAEGYFTTPSSRSRGCKEERGAATAQSLEPV
jgi:hypothetical protein